VTKVASPESTANYEYDALGNGTRIETPEKTVDYEYNPDRELIDADEVPR
jgi:hypothetical protein